MTVDFPSWHEKRLKNAFYFFPRNGTLLAIRLAESQLMAHAHSRRRNRTECETRASKKRIRKG